MLPPESRESENIYHAVAFIIITPKLEILAEERKKPYSPYYQKKVIPAGLIEEGETEQEAVKREILEETGIGNSNPVKIGSFTGKSLRNEPIQFKVYILMISEKSSVQTLEPEKSSHHWVPLEKAREVFELDTNHQILDLLERYLSSSEVPGKD